MTSRGKWTVAFLVLALLFSAGAAYASFQLTGTYRAGIQFGNIKFVAVEAIHGGYIGYWTVSGRQYLGNIFGNTSGGFSGSWLYDGTGQQTAGAVNVAPLGTVYKGSITLYRVSGAVKAVGTVTLR